MMSIIDSKNNSIRRPNDILNEQAKFYKNLYASDPKAEFYADFKPEAMVPEDLKKEPEGPLTLHELGVALRTMKNNKTPGLDGLPADFYKMFYKSIKELLLQVFNELFKLKRIFTSAKHGVIALILKKGRDFRFLKNWRPIILLCVDYKILSKMIANRVKVQLEKSIHYDQSAFLKGGNITNSIRKVIDTIRYCDRKMLNAVMLSIDFEKAFDRVEYSSLFKRDEISKPWRSVN